MRFNIEDSDKLIIDGRLDKGELLLHLSDALEYYQDFIKISKQKLNEETKANLKKLFGLVKYQKLDFYSKQLSISEKITLFTALDAYRNKIEEMALINESVINSIMKDLDALVEEDEKKKAAAEKPKLTEKEIINLNKVQNKRLLDSLKINSFNKMMIYKTIDEWFDNVLMVAKNNNKTQRATAVYKQYTVNFVARFSAEGERMYRIQEVTVKELAQEKKKQCERI